MSSSSQQAANATTNTVQSGLYGTERAEQDASGAIQTSQAYKDQAVETYDGLTSSGKDKLESVQNQVLEAANTLQAQASARVDGAVAQGQRDVEETKATSATYLDQAKAVAGTALGTAQDVLQQGAAMVAPADPYAPGIITTLQTTTSNALEATGGYLASAQAALTSNVPQETKQGVTEALDNTKVSAIEAATTAAVTAKSALHEPSQTVSNAQAAAQPHVDAAKNTASNLVSSATRTAATTSNAASTKAQDTKAAVSGHTTAASNTVQEYTPKVQETGSAHAKSIPQERQSLVDQAKGMLNPQQEPVTPVGLPSEGIEGVLKYGEDKSDSAKRAEQRGEYPKVKAY